MNASLGAGEEFVDLQVNSYAVAAITNSNRVFLWGLNVYGSISGAAALDTGNTFADVQASNIDVARMYQG